MKSNTFIGIDPGLSGGISVIFGKTPIVYNMPIRETKSGKNEYDVTQLVRILKPFSLDPNTNVIVALESVHSMVGEGSSSSFNFGKGFGTLIGSTTAIYGSEPILVTPQAWKKHFPEISESQDIIDLKELNKQSNNDINVYNIQIKSLKDKDQKKRIKDDVKTLEKEIAKRNRQIKTFAKSKARLIAAERYPELSNMFKKVKDDGLAESLLICIYIKEKHELV